MCLGENKAPSLLCAVCTLLKMQTKVVMFLVQGPSTLYIYVLLFRAQNGGDELGEVLDTFGIFLANGCMITTFSHLRRRCSLGDTNEDHIISICSQNIYKEKIARINHLRGNRYGA